MAASDSSGDDSRMSWPTTIRGGREVVDVRPGDPVRPVGIELVGDHAADVVRLEDLRVERHARQASTTAPGVPQQLPGVVQVLGHHAHVGEHRHEVDVAVPARHDVQVQVPLDAGAGRAAEVEADVRAVRPERRVEHAERVVEQLPQLGPLLGVEVAGRRQVPVAAPPSGARSCTGRGSASRSSARRDAARAPRGHPRRAWRRTRSRRRSRSPRTSRTAAARAPRAAPWRGSVPAWRSSRPSTRSPARSPLGRPTRWWASARR